MEMIGWITLATGTALNFLVLTFWKPALKAYAEEKGKRLATKEDINNVLEQLRLTTRETAAIQAEISGGLWLSQWHLAQKRDTYARLIDALENMRVQRDMLRRGDDKAQQGEQDAIAEFRRARAMARLMVSSDALVGIGRLLRRIGNADPSNSSDDEYLRSSKLIRIARNNVVAAGKIELGLVKPPSSGPGEDPIIS